MPESNLKKPAMIGFIAILVVVCCVLVKVPYTVNSRAYLLPSSEFTIYRTIEGNLISTLTDHHNDVVKRFSVTEFQRGDVAELILRSDLRSNSFLHEGDTIGYISSNEEMRNLIDLEGQLDILKAELLFFTTGQKPEDVLLALNQLELSEQDYRTQILLMERAENIYQKGAISRQEYDIELNTLKVKELDVKIARARWESVSTGEKPEQEALTLARIRAVSNQVAQIRERLKALVIKTPISGRLRLSRDVQTTGQLLTIEDTLHFVALIPVPLSELTFVKSGASVQLGTVATGTIHRLDRQVKTIDNRQTVYANAVLDASPYLMKGYISPAAIETDTINIARYLYRSFGLENNPWK